MKIFPELFQAYLKCPTKCWLRAAGEVSTGNAYTEWVKTQDETYRVTETSRLVGNLPPGEVETSRTPDHLKSAKWKLATNLAVQASLNSCSTESTLHAVERIPSEGRGKAAQFIPIRFIFRNKLTKDDKLLVAFDAFVLAQAIGRDIAVGKIIHGDLRGCARESAANSEVSTPIHGASSIATDGTNPIGLFGPEMGSFASLIWYKASIAYEPLSNGNVRIRYWLNGVLRGTSEFPAVPYEADLVYLTIWAGEGSAWFDNVSVRSFAEITASANAQTNFVISWPAAAAGFDLVSATNANAPIWTLVSQPPTIVNGQNFVTNPIAGSARFFRLRNR